MVADRSPDAKHWTSVRLQKFSLYMETVGGRRFELSLETHVPGVSVTYRLAQCNKPRTTSKAAIQVSLLCSTVLSCVTQPLARRGPIGEARQSAHSAIANKLNTYGLN